MTIMDDAEIVYAIATGDTPKDKAIKLIKSHIDLIRRNERIRIANKLVEESK